MLLFIDSETTGLPLDGKPSNDPGHPHVVQWAGILDDDTGKTILEFDFIIKPDGWEIPADMTAIHGIDTKTALERGVPLAHVLQFMWKVLVIGKSPKLVAHNVFFDFKMLKICCARHTVNGEGQSIRLAFESLDQLCTKKMAQYRWPKSTGLSNRLTDVYKRLFDQDFEDSHTALADARACRSVYYALKQLNEGG